MKLADKSYLSGNLETVETAIAFSYYFEAMTISELPNCPNCGDRNLSEVADYVSPDERDREPCKYWWCLSCDWKSEIFYYPALQPELGLWEPTETPIEMSQETYRELYELLHGLATDLPFNQKVKAALQRLEAAKIVS